VFVLASESDLPEGANVLGSRFHLTIKSKNENVRYKARLVVQGHLDAEKEFIVPEAPTLSHLSLRLIFSISVQNEWPLWTKDVTMAYLQSSSPLSRTVYISSPRSPTFVRETLHGHVIRVSKPLYGLVDSGLYWFNTYYQEFHGIRMEPPVLDECLMYRTGSASQKLDGLAGIQVDDTLMSGTMAFRTDETAMHFSVLFIIFGRGCGALVQWRADLQCVGHTEAAITQTPYIHKLLADPSTSKTLLIYSLCVASSLGSPKCPVQT
jgi:hypothetical protein